jgi:lysine biosynthesis protein LysW
MSDITIHTPWGSVIVGNEPFQLGELMVTDDGVEIEVVNLNPLEFREAPMESEDWGE